MKSKALFYLIVVILLTFFALFAAAVHAQTFSVIHTFTGHTDGADPSAGVTIRGNALYGTTYGNNSNGTVYQLTHSGSNWSFSSLAALPLNWNPWSRVLFGPDGHLYGASGSGGTYLAGAASKVTPQIGPCRDVACYWKVTDLHDFGSDNDGSTPGYGDLIWDQQGNIYGTTVGGGTTGNGAVYDLMPSGDGYTESVLYSFSGSDGSAPWAGLLLDNKGNLFGTTSYDDQYDFGTVFELTYVPGVGWTEQVIYRFQNASDGQDPLGGLISDSAGNLYGTAFDGGGGGSGTVFELSPSGDIWTFKLLYSFSGNGRCGPAETLTMDAAGNLYGTTFCGGTYNNGSVFKLSNTENGWVYTSLYDFTGDTDGGHVASNVSIDTDGTLYGTTTGGGDMSCGGGYGCGVVWMIKP